MMPGVYIIKNTIDERVYIGSSVNIRERWREHKRELLKCNHQNTHLQNFVNKYGIDVLIFEILENCEDTLEREQYYLDSIHNKFNIATSASAPMLGKKHSKEAINKIRIRSSGENNPMFGKKRPKEVLDKISKASKWRVKNKSEKVIRIINLPNRTEVITEKGNIFFSISHAAKSLGVKSQSVSISIQKGFKCKGVKVQKYNGDFYNKEFLLNNIDKFDDDVHPQIELIEMLKSLPK